MSTKGSDSRGQNDSSGQITIKEFRAGKGAVTQPKRKRKKNDAPGEDRRCGTRTPRGGPMATLSGKPTEKILGERKKRGVLAGAWNKGWLRKGAPVLREGETRGKRARP